MRTRTELDTLSHNLREVERDRNGLLERAKESSQMLAQLATSIDSLPQTEIERTALRQELELGHAHIAAEAAHDAAQLAEQSEREQAMQSRELGARLAHALSIVRRQQEALTGANLPAVVGCDELLSDPMCTIGLPPASAVTLRPRSPVVGGTPPPPQTPRAYARRRRASAAVPRAGEPSASVRRKRPLDSAPSNAANNVMPTSAGKHNSISFLVSAPESAKRRRGGVFAETAATRARRESAMSARDPQRTSASVSKREKVLKEWR